MRERWLRNRWWVMRVVLLPVHLFVFSLAVFVLVRAIPGDPVLAATGGQITHAQYLKAKASLGLDGSILSQLGSYLNHLVHLNLGDSIQSSRPVISDVRHLLPQTVELAVLGLTATIVFALVASYLVVMRPANPVSRLLALFAQTAAAVPDFVLAVTGIFIFYATLRWAPPPLGLVDTNLTMPPTITGFPLIDALVQGQFVVFGSIVAHLVLPVVVLALANAPVLMKLLIRALDEAVDAPPVRFRIATGCRRITVVLSLYRRALPAVVTMVGTMFGYLLGGAVVLEQLFGLAGMGQYAVNAVDSKDIVVLQGFLLIVGALSLVVFLLVDVVNMLIDPRRRAGVQQGALP